jgi:DNA-binding CsgD family transcriptional regulator
MAGNFAQRSQADFISVLEAVYAVEQSRDNWLSGVLQASSEALCSHGVGGVLYDASARDVHMLSIAGAGLSPELLNLGVAQHRDPQYTEVIAENYRTILCARQTDYSRGPDRDRMRRQMADHEVRDALMVNGIDETRQGLALYMFNDRPVRLSVNTRLAFERFAVHLANAYRLQRRLARSAQPPTQSADAVFGVHGRLEYVASQLPADGLEQLQNALQRREWSLGSARREQPQRALSVWNALVNGRWSLIDHFDSDGKRYILAQENAVRSVAPSELSSRERQTARLAALGRSNKIIAYELGLAHSTVRVLLARAASKLGAQTRDQLVAAMRRTRDHAPRRGAHSGDSTDPA